MTDFLLELRSEEIPARMQGKAREDLARLFAAELAKAGLAAADTTTYATPRRLALILRGLPDAAQAVSEETKGPKTSAPPQALDGFLRKTGLTRDQLVERDGILFAVTQKPGRATADVLAEAIPAVIRAFPWPKSMRWGDASASTESLRWVRPLQGIVALFGSDIVPVEIAGLTSGAATVGHRFHHPGAITIGSPDDYVEKLRACHVIADQDERQSIIALGATMAAAKAGLTLVRDEGLLIENAGLTEWPMPLLGRFDAGFLDVPPEVIQLTARVNQKYFVCQDGAGKLANAFICTANIDAADGGARIVEGNRKVLAARLSDARFFYEQDLKVPLEQQAEKLKKIVFHEKLGTVADKVDRVAKLARWLVEEGIILPGTGRGTAGEAGGGGGVPQGAIPVEAPLYRPSDGPPPRPGEDKEQLADLAERAARLCKADLVTGMVGEFPELQGLMGGYYAAAQGEDPRVAAAIRDHYKPVGAGDDVPTDPVTVAVSLADKLDTLMAFAGIREMPTGSRDPYALRRAALGILATITANSLRIKIGELIQGYARALLEVAHSAECVVYGLVAYKAEGGNGEKSQGIWPLLTLADWQIENGEFDDVWVCNKDELDLIDKPIQLFGPNVDEFKVRQIPDLALILHSVIPFLADRLKVQQREAGVRHDLIDAVFALGGEDDLVRLLARVRALQSFVATADGANLLAGYKRAANILKKEGVAPNVTPAKAGVLSDGAGQEPHETPAFAGVTNLSLSYTPEIAETALIAALDAAEPAAASAVAQEDFEGAMAALATLRAPIDAFFEGVTVNDPQADKRLARLALLARVRAAVHTVADFSRIEG